MTRDDVIRMAREAGVNTDPDIMAVMERFAAMVAAAEREACALVCDGKSKEYLARSPRHQHSQGAGIGASVCSDAIRSRGTS